MQQVATMNQDAPFWDKIAEKYSRRKVPDPAGYAKTLERTRHYLRPSDTVLEVGCGTGTTALKLALHVAEMTATDVSGEMIRIAEGKKGSARNVKFRTAPAEAQIGRFDVVIAMNLIHLLRNWQGGVQALADQVAPGGYLISKSGCLKTMGLPIRVMIKLMQMIGKAPHVALFDADELEEGMKKAGLEIVEAGRHSKGRGAACFIVARKPA